MKPADRHRDTTRTDMHRAVDTICDAWPYALTDAQSRGYPNAEDNANSAGVDGAPDNHNAGIPNPVASIWLGNIRHVSNQLYLAANMALKHWPARPTRTAAPGGRPNDIELCGLCELPVIGGHSDPIRRLDGAAFHAKSCWFTVTRQRAG